MAGGLFVPEDVVIYPPYATRFLIERAQAAGAKLHLGVAVSAIGKGRVRLADGSEFSAGAIVNAAGVWSGTLTPGVIVKKRKGHLVLTDCYPGFIHHQLVELGYLEELAFHFRQIRWPSIFNHANRDRFLSAHRASTEPSTAKSTMPSSSVCCAAPMNTCRSWPSWPRFRTWTGFRPAGPDNLPLIGPWPGDPNIISRHGPRRIGNYHSARDRAAGGRSDCRQESLRFQSSRTGRRD